MNSPIKVKIIDTHRQYHQNTRDTLEKYTKEENYLLGWKNDVLISQIALLTNEKDINNLEISAKNFYNAKGRKFASSFIHFEFLKTVQAYSGYPDPENLYKENPIVPIGDREESTDILMNQKIRNIPAATVQMLWMKINIPDNIDAGVYNGEVVITAKELSEELILPYKIDILDGKLITPMDYKKNFDIELWQNPFIVAEYYGVEPFSPEHFKILTPHMELYKMSGGDAITATIIEEAWSGQTYSKNKIKFPSMIKWQKNENGEFTYDYSIFDRWIRFNQDLGIGEKIVCYSIVPWTNSIMYHDEKTATIQEIKANPKDPKYVKQWEHFLTDFMKHVENLSIKENIYIGIDEKGVTQENIEIIQSVKGSKDGQPFKISGALDSFMKERILSEYIDDLTVGTLPIKQNLSEFLEFIQDRKNKKLKTTVYSCTRHVPGNYSLSEPMETYWTMLFSYAVGGEGFLRWAYDSWVENPLEDSTHHLFEPGDTFLVFPDEKNSAQPISQASVRLEKIVEGLRDIQKMDVLAGLSDEYQEKIHKMGFNLLKKYDHEGHYLTADGKEELEVVIEHFKSELNQLTRKAIAEGYSLDSSHLIK